MLAAGAASLAANAQAADDPTDEDFDGQPGIAEVPDPLGPPPVSVLAGAGTLLIDRTHGNTFAVSGFTNFLAANGWDVQQLLEGPITYEALSGADVLMVPIRPAGFGSIFPFTEAEIAAVRSFLDHGNGIWVLNDNVDPTGVNTLASAFGVTFNLDFVRDPSNNEGELFWPTIYRFSTHPLFDGVESYGYYLGDCITVSVPTSVAASGDDDSHSFFCPVGSFPPTLAVLEGAGRAVFAGDITTLSPQWFPNLLRDEEELLLQNIANWLLGAAPTATNTTTWGSVKRRFAGATESRGAGPPDRHLKPR